MYSIHTFLLQKELFRSPEPVKTTVVSSFTDTPALQQIARQADSDYILFYTGTSPIGLHPYAIGRKSGKAKKYTIPPWNIKPEVYGTILISGNYYYSVTTVFSK